VEISLDIPQPIVDIFKQIVDVPVLEDALHHYTSVEHVLQIRRHECDRVHVRRGVRVAPGLTHFLDFEIGLAIPVRKNVTRRWLATDRKSNRSLRVDIDNAPDAYRKTCRVWLAYPLQEGEEFDVMISAKVPLIEVDTFACVGVKLRGFKCGIDRIRISLRFANSPAEVRPFVWKGGKVDFAPFTLSRIEGAGAGEASFETSLVRPEDQQILIAWFREGEEMDKEDTSAEATRLERVDLGVITIREDEFNSVVDRLPNRGFEKGKNRTYVTGKVLSNYGSEYRVAVVRAVEQGPNAGQDAARDMVEDLDPQWLAVVGIGGAVPETEFTLGDVVVANRLHDFTVGAVLEDSKLQFADQGGPMKKEIQDLLAVLPALLPALDDWNSKASLRVPRPEVSFESENFYGPEEWRKKTEKALRNVLSSETGRTSPKVVSRSIASSGFLIKDTHLVDQWRQTARDLCVVEMELAGVYSAARRMGKEYPILAIRGISDVIGFKRSPEWTTYACQAAASLFFGLLKNMSPKILSPLAQPRERDVVLPNRRFSSSGGDGRNSPTGSYKPELPIEYRQHYLREFRCWSSRALEASPSDAWNAAVSARLAESDWPWSLAYFLQSNSNDSYAQRESSPNGFKLRYFQSTGYYLFEEIVADGTGSLSLFESQAFQNTDREGFPYDNAIATTADAIRFAVRFFKGLGLDDNGELNIKIEWSGFGGRHITAATVPMTPAAYYFKKIARTDHHRSPAIVVTLASADVELVPATKGLLSGFFSQFDFFSPDTPVYEHIIHSVS